MERVCCLSPQTLMQAARECVCVHGMWMGVISPQSVVVRKAGGWWVHVLLALGHWCCLAASHHVPSPLLSSSTAVARPLTPIPGAVAEAAAVSATTVKSELAHSPLPPDLPPRFQSASRWVYDIAIRTAMITDMDFLPRYNP